MMKKCGECSTLLPEEDFYVSHRGGTTKWCRACLKEMHPKKPTTTKEQVNAWSKHKTPATKLAARVAQLKAQHGISWEEFVGLLADQGNRCALCEVPLALRGRNTHIDHDHETKHIRGILCRECNIGLGKFRDNPALMRRAAIYVEASR